MEPALGLRVVRGPDWDREWGDHDGGEGSLGTVAGLESSGKVIVQWDNGQKSRYRCGHDNRFDLRVQDSAQIGVKHQSVKCGSCRGDICGFLWRCVQCSEYSLCSQCYMAGKHSTLHSFMRMDSDSDGVREKVSPRDSTRTGILSGIFPGAVVVRGADWRWENQDGGAGNDGEVKTIKDWKNDFRCRVEVLWRKTGKINGYRLGIKGKVDVKCEVASSGGPFYPEHLPLLGGKRPAPTGDLAAGDMVKVALDPDDWKAMQSGHGEWNDLMAEFIGTTGQILHISDSGDLLVSYPCNAVFHVNPQAVTKVETPVYSIGDVVSVNDDRGEVSKMQKGHGDWVEDMTESLGHVGKVVKVLPSGDVQVAVKGRRWVFNPCCLQPAPGEQPTLETNESNLSALVKAQLQSLMEQSSADVVAVASAAGDISTIRSFLKDNPDKVNAKVRNKTGLIMATAEGWLNVVQTLLEFNASVNETDEDGETALHYCAHLNRAEIAKELIDHDADPNACNQTGVFPLAIATALGNYDVLNELLKSPKVNLQLQDLEGNTALHMAVVAHRSEAVRVLLEAGAKPTIPNHGYFTPILEAAKNGFYAGLEQFLRKFPEEVNSPKGDDCHTALHIAAANDHLDIVCLLAETEGCNLDARNVVPGFTPLHTAACEGYTRVIERLIGYGADLNATDDASNTALSVVIGNRGVMREASHDCPQIQQINTELYSKTGGAPLEPYVGVVCLLAREGATFNADVLQDAGCAADVTSLVVSYCARQQSYHGSLQKSLLQLSTGPNVNSHPSSVQKALIDAVKRGQADKVKHYHEAGAKLTVKDASGFTALHHAARLGKHEVVEYLVAHLPREALDIVEEEKQQTPLHKAAWYGYFGICKLLVENGASLVRQDYEGNTPLSKAKQHGDRELQKYLISKEAEQKS